MLAEAEKAAISTIGLSDVVEALLGVSRAVGSVEGGGSGVGSSWDTHGDRWHLKLLRLAEAQDLGFRRYVQDDWHALAWERLGPPSELLLLPSSGCGPCPVPGCEGGV